MTTDPAGPGPCTRCGRPLRGTHRFCPECGLPAKGAVLSSEIGAVRQQAAHSDADRPRWRRVLPRVLSVAMLGFVIVLGAVLFDRGLMQRFVPPVGAEGPRPVGTSPSWEPEWTVIPAGSFYVGKPLSLVEDDLWIAPTLDDPPDPEIYIVRHAITNRWWRDFLVDQERPLRAAGLWDLHAFPLQASGWHLDDEGRPEPYRDPVTGEPQWNELVSHVTLEAIQQFVRWIWWHDAPRLIDRLGVSNEAWERFLESQRDALVKEGLLDVCTPADWTLDETGQPVPPYAQRGAEPSALHQDATGLVRGVPIEAVLRYRDWGWLRTTDEYRISTYEIRNELWRDFLEHEETALFEEGLWLEAVPGPEAGWEEDDRGRWVPPVDKLDRPVVNVTARAVRRFAAWLTVRLAEPGMEIRMPTTEEWEYAARGTDERMYPWGDRFLGVPVQGTGDPRLRAGLDANDAVNVDHVEEDESAFGVIAMGTNVAEWVAGAFGTTELRGGSFADLPERARLNAKAWIGRSMEEGQRFNHVGVRLVKVRVQTR